MWNSECGIRMIIYKMKERSDTTIPHSEIHTPNFLRHTPTKQ